MLDHAYVFGCVRASRLFPRCAWARSPRQLEAGSLPSVRIRRGVRALARRQLLLECPHSVRAEESRARIVQSQLGNEPPPVRNTERPAIVAAWAGSCEDQRAWPEGASYASTPPVRVWCTTTTIPLPAAAVNNSSGSALAVLIRSCQRVAPAWPSRAARVPSELAI